MKLLTLVVALVAALCFANCGSDSGMKCQDGTNCPTTGSVWKACCSSTQCEYRAGSEVFKCNGLTDCQTAAQNLDTYCGISS